MEDSAAEPTLPTQFLLCDDLCVHPQDGDRFVLEDAGRGKFYRLGSVETSFVQALIETGSAVDAQQASALSTANAVKLCKWLEANGLVQGTETSTPQSPPKQSVLASAFFWKVRLMDPDRLLRGLVATLGWLFSPQAVVVGFCVFVAGVVQTSGRWSEFSDSYQNLSSSWRWLTLAAAWCGLKVIHEIAHGATCRRYGGEVKDAGLAMILFVPIAYVSVTSSWRFPSRWQRFHVTLAGVATELFVAGVALIAWNMMESMPLKQMAADIVLLASVSSLLFNLNPLLKFDGYFALADATGVDNLYGLGQRYARYFGSRYILGLDATAPKLPGNRTTWIKAYGVAAACYRAITVAGLLMAASALFHGAGIFIAIAGVVAFVVRPLWMLVRHLSDLRVMDNLSLTRLSLRLTCLLALVGAPMFVIPANWTWTAPAIVEYDPPAVLRNRSAGFVEVVHVRDGQKVAKGQPIVTLRNEELELELLGLKRTLAHVRQETLAAQWTGQSGELSDAQKREKGLVEQIAELTKDVDGLVVRAASDGTVVSRKLSLIVGTYVAEGEELAVIGREHTKRLKVSISQLELSDRGQWIGRPVSIVVHGHRTWSADLTRLETRASVVPPDDALIASNGGPLAAIQVGEGEATLCEPRVNAYISLTAEQSEPLRCGQRAFVRLVHEGQSLGSSALGMLRERLELSLL